MRSRACIAILLFLSACASTGPIVREPTARERRMANLQRAAALPWKDGGRCVVREASQPWPELVERCYPALDHDRVEFHDTTGRCTVASAEAATLGLGFCVLAAPEIAVGAVIVLGVVVVGVVINEALEAYELRHHYPEEAGASRGTKTASRDAVAKPKTELEPEPAGQGRQPPVPPVPVSRTRRASCEPIPVPHAGEDRLHNECADVFPPNRYPGHDVLVNGKRFDALQIGARVLWEIKTHQFDTYSDFLRDRVIEDQMEELQKDRAIAAACGYDFIVGVSSAAHKAALIRQDPRLNVVVTGCTR
ncbi:MULTISPECIES: DUF6310 domain-containing protein [unclassified Corallococcus]|uniref:DUF6310 domain-containing protein n=1 Tax=unclassified Corallococcus TaxID=2685029 RepID=UPI001A8D30F6|nr:MULTISPECIES: DUF6310 domain-containing protein [unclassified Corallococcus]MBN9684170.1 hypothetical protein [Corallococcus sp. NCSPR001]WAS89475.1 DUF6310 domain-containing protein [Corallococcus sp. NCRR]